MSILRKPFTYTFNANTLNTAIAATTGFIATGVGSWNIGTTNVMSPTVTALVSSEVTAEVNKIELVIQVAASVGTNNNMLFDLMYDDGSGAGWQTAISSIPLNQFGSTVGNETIELPCRIPANSHIGMRAQAVFTGAVPARANVTAFGGSNDPTQSQYTQGVVVVGDNRTSTWGVPITPDSNAISLVSAAWQTIGTVPVDIRALRIGTMPPQATTVNAAGISFQIGVNNNPLRGFPVGGRSYTTNEHQAGTGGHMTYDVQVEAGSVLLIRGRSSAGAPQQIAVIAHGVM